MLYRASGAVTLVGGGPVPPPSLAAALALAPEAVAADAGGDVELPGGARFRMVIGDLDSLADAERLRAADIPVHRLTEQESTDLEKCLYAVEAPLYLCVGFLGGRLDHTLAAITALVRRPAGRVILIGADDIAFLCPEVWQTSLPEGTRISLWPIAPVRGRADGLRWPLDGPNFRPDGRIGTSNEAAGGTLRLRFTAGKMAVILPARHLETTVGSLSGR